MTNLAPTTTPIRNELSAPARLFCVAFPSILLFSSRDEIMRQRADTTKNEGYPTRINLAGHAYIHEFVLPTEPMPVLTDAHLVGEVTQLSEESPFTHYQVYRVSEDSPHKDVIPTVQPLAAIPELTRDFRRHFIIMGEPIAPHTLAALAQAAAHGTQVILPNLWVMDTPKLTPPGTPS